MQIRNTSVIYVSENVQVVKIWKVTWSSTIKNITIAPNVSNLFPWTNLKISAFTCSSMSTCWLRDPTNASLAEKSSKLTRFCKHIWRKPDLTIIMSVYSVISRLRHMMSMSDMYFKYILENGFTGKLSFFKRDFRFSILSDFQRVFFQFPIFFNCDVFPRIFILFFFSFNFLFFFFSF